MITQTTYERMMENQYLMDSLFCNIWFSTTDYEYYDFPKYYSETYNNRKELLGIILERLLIEEKIKLLKDEELMEVPIKEQVLEYMNLFPSEDEMEKIEDYWCHTTAIRHIWIRKQQA